MIKTVYKILLVLSLFTILVSSEVLAYSDELFEFDLPSTYGHLSYSDMYVFADTNNSNRGMIIYAKEENGLKKSVWDIEKEDLDRIIRTIGSNVISTEKKAKLGKEKAIKVILEEDNEYIELYILASNKYIYMVTFVAQTQLDLENSDYKMIKESFKLKDRTTNPMVIYILIIIVIAAFTMYKKIKNPKNNYLNQKYPKEEIDYKNMTEEDFKNMN